MEGRWLFWTENVSVWRWHLSVERPEKVSRSAYENLGKSFLGNGIALGVFENRLEIQWEASDVRDA